jgi:hypothetical protein
VDDADLLQVLFAFGGRGYRNEDLNWDGTVDDADLLQLREWVLALTPAPLSLQRGEGRLFHSPLASVVILSLLIAAQSVLTDNQKVRFPLQAEENLQERGRVLSRSSFGSYCRQEEPKSDWFSEEIPQSYPRFSATACPIFASFRVFKKRIAQRRG